MKKLFILISAACMIIPMAGFAQEVKRTEDDKTITVVEETKTDAGRVVAPGVWPVGAIDRTDFPRQAYELGRNLK